MHGISINVTNFTQLAVKNFSIQNTFSKLKTDNLSRHNFDTLLKNLYLFIEHNFQPNNKFSMLPPEVQSLVSNMKTQQQFKSGILNITPVIVAETLKILRLQAGYTLSGLENITGFSKTSISHRESTGATTYPNLNTIEIYLAAFNLSILEFIYLVILNTYNQMY